MTACPSCGAATTIGSAFCGECGAAVEPHDTVSGGGATNQPPTPAAASEARAPSASRAPAGAVPGTVPGSPLSEALRASPAAPPAPAPIPAPPAGAPRGPRHLPSGTVVDGKYSIERVLGEGGMGVVYLARDVHTGVEVVLKAIRAELAHRQDVRERTLAEGRALARIDHPNVVQLKAVVVEGPALWLVMQYVEGESLEDTIGRYARAGERMPLGQVVSIFRQILGGMAAAHREGVIHRDLKPANVLIRRKDGVAKVGDFGIAKGEEEARAGRGQTKGVIGSLWYMSPEQVTGRRDLDRRVDIYALGIVLYEMLLGEVPFDSPATYDIMRAHAESPVPLVAKQRSDVSPALDALIQKACAKSRDARFASCEEFAAALDAAVGASAAASGAPIGTTVDTVPHPSIQPSGAGSRSVGAPGAGAAIATGAPGGGATGEPTTTLTQRPAEGRSRGWLWGLAALVVVGGGAALAVSLGVVPMPAGPRPSGRPSAQTTAPSATTPTTASAVVARNPLDPLVGAWLSDNGREFDAVLVGAAIEFRVVNPAQFERQGYQVGEARFVLRPIAGDTTTFAVEDRVRPLPPADLSYDTANARSTCVAVWTSASGRPLRASLESGRLSVDFAKIAPGEDNFFMKGDQVLSCRALEKLPASIIPGTLTRR